MSSLVLHFPSFRLDPSNERLWDETLEIPLRPKTFAVLRYLVEHPEQLVTKDELMNAVWSDTVVSDDALTGCIRDLRKVLGDDAQTPRYIETVHRRGYRFIGKVVSQEEVVSRQHSVVSRQEDEENQKAKGKNQKAKVEETEIETDPKKTEEVDAGPQTPDAGLLSQPSEGRAGFARRKGALVVAGLLLLAGTIVIVRYFSLPLITHHSSLVTEEAQPPLPLPAKPSIAVMPFTNMSGDPKQEYFSDGLTDDLITALSRLSQLFVIARHSTFTYKGKAVKVQEVSKELGVRYVLEGSVQRSDGQVRINAQLVDATTGHHIWAERYDREWKDIFALQDDIVRKIVTTLRLQVNLQEKGILVPKTTDNLEAYDSHLHGLEFLHRTSKENNLRARQMFEKAIALDPQYAEPYGAVGFTYYLELAFGWSQDVQMLEQALRMGQRAVALNDSLSWPHGLLALIYTVKNQPEQALAESERAIALDPNDSFNYSYRAETLYLLGRPAEALPAAQQAIRLNPRDPGSALSSLGTVYFYLDRYPEAISTFKSLLARNPNLPLAYAGLSFCYMLQWHSQQSQDPQTLGLALAAAQRAVALNPSLWNGHTALGSVYLFHRQYEQAIVEMKQATALAPNEATGYAALALVLSITGQSDEALQMVAEALRRKSIVVDQHLAAVGTVYSLAGKSEEAIAPLKQYLSHYPNYLDAHLTLAKIYSELGKDAEARAAAAEVLRITPNFSLEVLQERSPIKDPARLEQTIAALRKAGLK